MVKSDSSLQRTRFHHSSRRLALRMVILGLCAAAQQWKPISWSSRWTGLVPTMLPEAVSNSGVSVATDYRQFFPSYPLQRSHSVSLCGLPLRGWAVVAPRCFYFTITALTVDRAALTRQKFYKLTNSATLKVTEHFSNFSKATLLPMFVYGECMLCAQFYTHVRIRCGGNSHIQ